jgi:hypothetical protein
MGMTADSIREAHADVARYGSIRAAARETGRTFGHYQRRMQKPPLQEQKPRFKVPARVTGDESPHFSDAPQPRPNPLYSAEPPATLASGDVIRVLAIGDVHDDPYLPKDRFAWFGKLAAETQPDRIVQIGDICDLESLSFHSGNETDSGRYKPRFMADMGSLDSALETMFEPMAKGNVQARFDLTNGNHENRIWRFEDSAPETAGMLQRDFASIVGRYGIQHHQYGKYVDIGGVKFTHSPFSVMGKPIGGMTATNTIARQASGDIVCGHTHKASVITAPRLGGESKVTIIDLGCALPHGYVASYAKHTLTGWTWAVWMLTIQNGSIQGFNCIPMAELQRRFQ